MNKCPYCEADLSDTARKCRFCGEWLNCPPDENSHISQPTTSPAVVNIHQEESNTFAVITLLCYIFVFPVGVLLNVLGILTGPKRGCFMSMLFVFIILPIIICTVCGIPLLKIITDFVRKLN